tara:strand:+ start:117 stop:977 length:861 start_codon:yes stop_codon:yes gene_type:complete
MCAPLLEDISIEEIKSMYGFENSSKILQNPSKIPPKSSKILQNPSENPPEDFLQNSSKILQIIQNSPPKSSEISNPLVCPYCYKGFTRSDNLNRHYGRCKIIQKEKEDDKQEIKELKEMVEKLLLESKGNTTITNSNNITHHTTNNIININNYGDENTKYITNDYILNLLKNKPAKAIPELIKYTHFNEDHPENQNIKITNKKEPYVKVRKNDKWELQDKEETISDLIDRQHVQLMDESMEKKINIKCTTDEKGNIKRCNELYNEEDKEYMKRLYNESELIILNNS